jgi:hypothetical protein
VIRILHALLVLAAVPLWAVAMLLLSIALGLVVLADKVWPDANWGNCWSFAGAKWARHGGYLQVRWADFPQPGSRVIPHGQWVYRLHPNTGIQHTEPVRRAHRLRDVWKTLYFELRVLDTDRDQPTSWPDLDELS